MTYKKPNRKAPRARLKSARVMDAQTFKEFKEKHPEYSDLTLTEFNGIIKQFHKDIVEEVTEHRYGISLPERLGQLVIVSFPRSNRKVIDFGKSNKTGVMSYHRNWETDNRMGKLVYQTGSYMASFKYHRMWSFTAARGFKQRVSEAFVKMYQKYIQIDNNGISLRDALNGKR